MAISDRVASDESGHQERVTALQTSGIYCCYQFIIGQESGIHKSLIYSSRVIVVQSVSLYMTHHGYKCVQSKA